MRRLLLLLPGLFCAWGCGVPPCGEPTKPVNTVKVGTFRSLSADSARVVVVEPDLHVTESFTRDGHQYVARYRLVGKTYSRGVR